MDNLVSQRNQNSGTRMEHLRGRQRLPPHSLPRDGNTDTLTSLTVVQTRSR